MKLLTFLLFIQIGYIMAKSINHSMLCKKGVENDPRLKRSEEIEKDMIDSDNLEESAIRNTFDKDTEREHKTFLSNYREIDKGHDDYSDEAVNRSNKLNDFMSHFNDLSHDSSRNRRVQNDLSTEEGQNIEIYYRNSTKEPVIYQNIDPKFIITSELYIPQSEANNIDLNNSKKDVPTTIDVKEYSTYVNDLDPKTMNLSRTTNISNLSRHNDAVSDEETGMKETDILNLRELREHLLDHLLDYFLNIIKEERYTNNDTRKKNGKDKMKVEEKLRNYYDPHHLDLFVSDDDDSYLDENNLENSLESMQNEEEGLIKNNAVTEFLSSLNPQTQNNSEQISNTYLYLGETVTPKNLEEKQNINNSILDVESLYVDLMEKAIPVTSKHINFVKNSNKNLTSDVLINITEKYNDTTYVSEVESSDAASIAYNNKYVSSDFARISKQIEISTTDRIPLPYSSEEVIADKIDYTEVNNGQVTEDYSFEDFHLNDEYQIGNNLSKKPLQEKEHDKESIKEITPQSGRRNKDILEKEPDSTTTNNSLEKAQRNKANNESNALKKEAQSKSVAISEALQNNTDNNAVNFPNRNKNDLTKNEIKDLKKLQMIKGKLTSKKNKIYGSFLLNNDKKVIKNKSNRGQCEKKIIVSLNINLM